MNDKNSKELVDINFNEGMCSRCGKKPAQGDHTCPFAEEIHGDKDFLCDCCVDCEHECAMDI